jgi:hypothetical protein
MHINSKTTPAALRRHFRRTRGSIAWPLDQRMGPTALRRMVARFGADDELGDPLLQMIAAHPSADDAVVDDLLAAAPEAASVAHAVATSGRASARVLKALARHSDASVRDHAQLALIAGKLRLGLGAGAIERLLAEHQGDAGIALGVRAMVARSESCPAGVLKRLAEDSADFVALAARETLARGMMRARRKGGL